MRVYIRVQMFEQIGKTTNTYFSGKVFKVANRSNHMRKEKKKTLSLSRQKSSLAFVLVFTAQIIAIKAYPRLTYARRERERERERCVAHRGTFEHEQAALRFKIFFKKRRTCERSGNHKKKQSEKKIIFQSRRHSRVNACKSPSLSLLCSENARARREKERRKELVFARFTRVLALFFFFFPFE